MALRPHQGPEEEFCKQTRQALGAVWRALSPKHGDGKAMPYPGAPIISAAKKSDAFYSFVSSAGMYAAKGMLKEEKKVKRYIGLHYGGAIRPPGEEADAG